MGLEYMDEINEINNDYNSTHEVSYGSIQNFRMSFEKESTFFVRRKGFQLEFWHER